MLYSRVVDTSDRPRGRLPTLRAVSRVLARPLDVKEILRAVHLELARSLDVTICFFGLYDAAAQTVEVIWQIHAGAELPGGQFPLGGGPTSRAIRERAPQLIRRWSSSGPRVQVQYASDRAGLPESSIVVPVIFDRDVIGILAVQSYEPDVYDEDDVALVQGVADQIAMAVAVAQRSGNGHAQLPSAQLEAVLANMSDALLVLDDESRLVRLNLAARRLLCPVDESVILGHPVDQAQAGHWPLGSQRLTEQLSPVVGELRRGAVPDSEVEVALDSSRSRTVACRASVLMNNGAPSGGVVVLSERG